MRRPVWTKTKLRAGFQAFKKLHGHFPVAEEIDDFPLLPSARLIQKRFGGLPTLRASLGLTATHFGKGPMRSRIATEVNQRGRAEERQLENWLVTHFGERNVHPEKLFGHGKSRVDFYICHEETTFGIDIFYPNTLRTLESSLNIKQKKYQHFSQPLYIAIANPLFTQTMLDAYVSRKKNPLPSHITLLTKAKLMTHLRKKVQSTQ